MKFISLISSLSIIIILILLILPIQIISNLFNLRFKYIAPIYFFKLINYFIGINIELDQESRNHLRNKSDVGNLYISNHVSWIDIVTLGSLIKSSFIAKKEVKAMGIFGFLAILNNTYFIDNTKATKALGYSNDIQKKLLKGQNLILFPEGTTSDGSGIRSFKSSFFESANSKYICPNSGKEKYIRVQPITLSYLKKSGLPMGMITRREIAWIGSYPIIHLMLNYVMSGNVSIRIKIHDSVTMEDFADRKKLSAYCEDTILANLIDTLHATAS
ncbi:1-acyl-sn-glycerol-3-phosphate acyltransferase [Pelagibacteraceae bacterium]|nr:1-acyl-sn-glycerol-3-phosphate acyltransferase [Pelagibacteraceae bacterium]